MPDLERPIEGRVQRGGQQRLDGRIEFGLRHMEMRRGGGLGWAHGRFRLVGSGFWEMQEALLDVGS